MSKQRRAIKLDNLNDEELRNLKGDIETALEVRRQAERQELIDAVKAMVSAKGFTIGDLFSPSRDKTNKPKRKVALKYRSPDDPTLTWTGRGKTPVWLRTAVERGDKLEDYLIPAGTN